MSALALGPQDLETVFRSSQFDREEAPFMGDTAFLLCVRALSEGSRHLVDVLEGEQLPDATTPHDDDSWLLLLCVTEDGQRVLDGAADRCAFQSLDRWIGGVHLRGEPRWRWDRADGRLVSAGTE